MFCLALRGVARCCTSPKAHVTRNDRQTNKTWKEFRIAIKSMMMTMIEVWSVKPFSFWRRSRYTAELPHGDAPLFVVVAFIRVFCCLSLFLRLINCHDISCEERKKFMREAARIFSVPMARRKSSLSVIPQQSIMMSRMEKEEKQSLGWLSLWMDYRPAASAFRLVHNSFEGRWKLSFSGFSLSSKTFEQSRRLISVVGVVYVIDSTAQSIILEHCHRREFCWIFKLSGTQADVIWTSRRQQKTMRSFLGETANKNEFSNEIAICCATQTIVDVVVGARKTDLHVSSKFSASRSTHFQLQLHQMILMLAFPKSRFSECCSPLWLLVLLIKKAAEQQSCAAELSLLRGAVAKSREKLPNWNFPKQRLPMTNRP